MTGHFEKNLNLKQIILEKRPKLIVECGAGHGDFSWYLKTLQSYYPFELHVVSDNALDVPGLTYHVGLSYEVLKEFPDESIGMCILDTDHNYWTLFQELHAVKNKMQEGGLIVMHDVEEFYHDTGMAMSYWNDRPYPEKEIMAAQPQGGLGDALIDFLHDYRGYFKLRNYVTEHFGCAVIEKKTVTETRLVRPGTNPVFAKKT